MAGELEFDLKDYQESISNNFPAGILDQLYQIEDFRKAFEINSELAEIFKKVGIPGDFGMKGLAPSDWPNFGPVQKTLFEFKGAYDTFQEEIVSLIKKLAPKRRTHKKKRGKA